MKYVMLDLETMGTRPDAAIIAIGAVAFDLNGLGAEFYTAVDLNSAMQRGGTVDADTIAWWMRQSDEARQVFQEANKPISVALDDFARWMLEVAGGSQEQREELEVWGNGADFDNVILASAYRSQNRPQPWGRFKNRCYRTATKLLPSKPMARTSFKHNALADAKYQASNMLYLIDGLQKMTKFAEVMVQLADIKDGAAKATEGGAA